MVSIETEAALDANWLSYQTTRDADSYILFCLYEFARGANTIKIANLSTSNGGFHVLLPYPSIKLHKIIYLFFITKFISSIQHEGHSRYSCYCFSDGYVSGCISLYLYH